MRFAENIEREGKPPVPTCEECGDPIGPDDPDGMCQRCWGEMEAKGDEGLSDAAFRGVTAAFRAAEEGRRDKGRE